MARRNWYWLREAAKDYNWLTERVIPCEDDYAAIHWGRRIWDGLTDHDKENRAVFEIVFAPCNRKTQSPDLDHAELVANWLD